MRGGIVVIENLDDERNELNNVDPQINRGVELLLRNRRKRTEKPKTFQVKFGKMVSFLCREITIHLNFYLDVRRK